MDARVFIGAANILIMPPLKAGYFRKLMALMDANAHPWPKLSEVPLGRRLLVVAPHFDDETIGCGGTIRLHAGLGSRVTVVFLTDGGAGDREGHYQDIVAVRKSEAVKACGILGVSAMHMLDEPDGRLKSTDELCGRLASLISDIAPDAVFCPWPLDDGGDHAEAGRILSESIRMSHCDFRVWLYEVWSALPPNATVDVSAAISAKREALGAYASQLRYRDFVNASCGLNGYRSLYNLGGRGYAEAFLQMSTGEYGRLMGTG
jgi:N-acetylglucosamine malate deacetylase 1